MRIVDTIMVMTTDTAITTLINMRKLSRIFICVFAAVALMSCSKEQNGDPFILFEVHGKVMDAAGNPLEGINVIAGQADVQKTNINGNFTFFGRTVPADHVSLTFEDKDGDNNGGEFVKKTVEIPLRQKSPGTGGNYKGTFFAGDVEVVMVSRNVEMNPDSGLTPQGNGK
jgi:putative lipoprotein (rSAM/lipoprotein system)